MPVAGRHGGTPNDVRSLEAGMLLVGAGAILLLVSLFLVWYEPEAQAWDVFEAWDLVLALLAIIALVAVASRMGVGPQRPASWLIGPAAAALVIVLYVLVDPPPGTPDVDGDPSTGLWLGLVAAVLMTAGALLSVARISVAFTVGDGVGRDPAAPHDPASPGSAEPRRSARAGRGAGSPTADPGEPPAPGGVPPAEPTRRL